ncbi:hypothetical protein SAMN05216389_12115 [Oceanobacillus limi]|uniref:Carbohydrate-binding module family 96 domain-containing protein n=1 Tax=Oceanobacillus limi TaxID=930131 RepID=A0A1I0GE15_9BACI|nr:DNRLRE domain-containing protein [Oceanobacillus limi]SET69301.1 hypothetical protein SAMN05216389_12115 [Oceanobacillus limi]
MPTQSFKVGEMRNKRTHNSKTWINFDGSYTTEIHQGQIHYDDEHGNLHNINTDLYDEADFDVIDEPVALEGCERFKQAKVESKQAKDKRVLNRNNHNFQALRVPFDAHIPRNFQRGYTIGKGVDKLTFKPVKASPSMGQVESVDRSIITYQDVWNDTDVELKIQPNGIKETILLKTDRAPFSFAFEVKGKDIADDFTAGSLKLIPAWLRDANGTERDVEMVVNRHNDNKVYVELSADVSDLVYPIEIDPTVTIQPGASTGKDSYIRTSSPDASYNNSDELFVGQNDGFRFLIQFDLSTIAKGSFINNAILSLGGRGGIGSGYIKAKPYVVTEAWSEGVTWNNQPQHTDVGINEIRFYTGHAIQVDITNIAQNWFTNENNGLMFKQTDTTTVSASFHSSNSVNESNRPKLEITYNVPPSKPNLLIPNGGETWNSLHTITWDSSNDGSDSNSTPTGDLQYNIQLSTDNGENWHDVVGLTSSGVTSYEYDFINESETSIAKIRIRAYDGYSYGEWDESDGVFTIEHNFAPTIPTDLIPSGGSPQNREELVRLEWKHNDSNDDPQAEFDLQWRLQGNTTWNTVNQVTINEYYELSNLPHGTIEWRVRTYDQEGLASPYSDTAVFFAGDKPSAPTITSHNNGEVISTANPTIQWSSSGQVGYTLRVLESGVEVYSYFGTTNKAHTIQYDLENQMKYVVELTITNSDGLESDADTATLDISYTPPAEPILATSTEDAAIVIHIDNPTPVDTEPTVKYNNLYKRIDGEFVRIATNIEPNGQYTDYAVASGEQQEYFVRSHGDNNTYSDSGSILELLILNVAIIASAKNPSNFVNIEYGSGAVGPDVNANLQLERTLLNFAGRAKSVAEFGGNITESLPTTFIVKSREELGKLRNLVRNMETLLYRDYRGRKVYVTVGGLEELDISNGMYEVSAIFDEVDYKEEV